jgi:two-component system sensor histidine kinase/response regulator
MQSARSPGQFGFTLACEIRRHPSLEGTAIVMLTSAGGLGAAARCRELGISAYLTKPVGQEELRSAIGRALQSEPYENFPPLTAGSSPRRQGGPLRILLAEDNLVNQRPAHDKAIKKPR